MNISILCRQSSISASKFWLCLLFEKLFFSCRASSFCISFTTRYLYLAIIYFKNNLPLFNIARRIMKNCSSSCHHTVKTVFKASNIQFILTIPYSFLFRSSTKLSAGHPFLHLSVRSILSTLFILLKVPGYTVN